MQGRDLSELVASRLTEMQGASRLCGLKNCKHGCRAAQVDEAPTLGGNRLIVASARAGEVAEFIVAATEALSRDEAPYASAGGRAAYAASLACSCFQFHGKSSLSRFMG